jgi:hypothetical protein
MNQVNLFFHGLWILCGVGAVVFSANPVSSSRWTQSRGFGSLIFGFAIGMAFISPDRVPDPVWVGGVAALLAALLLFKPRTSIMVAAGYAGFLAALWGVLLRVQGTPAVLAIVLAAAVPAISAILTVRRPLFAPVHLREEALLIVLVLGLAVSMAPGVSAGWQSAVALNLEEKRTAVQAVPGWTIVTMLAAASLGGVYSLWTRR